MRLEGTQNEVYCYSVIAPIDNKPEPDKLAANNSWSSQLSDVILTTDKNADTLNSKLFCINTLQVMSLAALMKQGVKQRDSPYSVYLCHLGVRPRKGTQIGTKAVEERFRLTKTYAKGKKK